jgi:hypothetical protein
MLVVFVFRQPLHVLLLKCGGKAAAAPAPCVVQVLVRVVWAATMLGLLAVQQQQFIHCVFVLVLAIVQRLHKLEVQDKVQQLLTVQ